MKRSGQIGLVPFPYTDFSGSKLRPVLMVRQASRRYDDWLVCMVSSQLQQAEPALDEILRQEDNDFQATGLKAASVIRLSRLAVIDGSMLVGCIGAIGDDRLNLLRMRLATWLAETPH
ncbi:MAG: type II toxin-antitoxin system PemK/MazF family toxin [Rhodospirillaceae bacterium]